MSVPREAILKRAAEWFARANDDLFVCRRLLDVASSPAWIIAFHAQQCAEKSLKSFLVCRGEDFPYTHDIRLLLERCGGWSELLEIERLTVYAVSARYPGVHKEVTRAEAEQALRLAQSVFDHVKQRLVSEGVSAAGE